MHPVNGVPVREYPAVVESGTAVVEHFDGRLEIICWLDKLGHGETAKPKKPVESVTS